MSSSNGKATWYQALNARLQVLVDSEEELLLPTFVLGDFKHSTESVCKAAAEWMMRYQQIAVQYNNVDNCTFVKDSEASDSYDHFYYNKHKIEKTQPLYIHSTQTIKHVFNRGNVE